MTIKYNLKLSEKNVFELLEFFDDSSDIPLSEGLDFVAYSEKLSKYAKFVIAYNHKKMIGFVAYYQNQEGEFIYVPQIVVHKSERHKGIGHQMLAVLQNQSQGEFSSIELEVLKDNKNARLFYTREGFVLKEERETKLLLIKNI